MYVYFFSYGYWGLVIGFWMLFATVAEYQENLSEYLKIPPPPLH